MELLHSPRQSISPFKGIDGDQNINPDLGRRGKNRKGSGSEVGESHEDELNQVIDVSCRASATTSQRHKPSDRPVRKRGCSPS